MPAEFRRASWGCRLGSWHHNSNSCNHVMNWFAQRVGGSAGNRNRIPEIIYREEEERSLREARRGGQRGCAEHWRGHKGRGSAGVGSGGQMEEEGIGENHALGCWSLGDHK